MRNRAFQGSSNTVAWPFNTFDPTTDYWHPVGDVNLTIDSSPPTLSKALPHHMRVSFGDEAGQTEPVGFYNDGFWGVKVSSDSQYSVRLSIRGEYDGGISASFYDTIAGSALGSTSTNVTSVADAWTEVTFPNFCPNSARNPNNTIHFVFDDPQSLQGGYVDVNLLSVFPNTYKARKNGLRIDLAEAFEGLGTSWTRLPGGNSMQGPALGEQFTFNETIGALEDRPGMLGVWGSVFTNGLGLLEQMQWMQDTNQEVFLGIFAGLHIGGDLVPEEDIQPYVQLALDELEFLMVMASSLKSRSVF